MHRRTLCLFVTLALVSSLAVAVARPASSAEGDPVITEFMASNSATLADGYGLFPDWIEIHNPSGVPIDLEGWQLTDETDHNPAWTFPSTIVDPGGFLIVFASGLEAIDPAGYRHTDFALAAAGEYVALLDPADNVISEYAPSYPAQTGDVSYGLGSDATVGFFSTPTPGTTNGAVDAPRVEPVVASLERGFYATPQTLTLTTQTSGAQIRYTADGTEPTDSVGTLYTEPLTISGTTTVRAVAFAPDMTTSRPTSLTYLFLDDVITQPPTVPGHPDGVPYAVNGSQQVLHDSEMDPGVVTSPAYATEIVTALTEIPTLSIVGDPEDLFGPSGAYDTDDIEHEVSLELLYPNDPASNQQVQVGVEGHSHLRLKRSLRLNFRSAYGVARWDTPLLTQAPLHGDTAATQIKTLVLRGGNNRSWARNWNPDATTYVEDQFYRDSQIAMSGTGAHGTFAHLYINGVYYGLFNPTERPDDDWAPEYYGGNDDHWFFTNHGGAGMTDTTRWDHLRTTLVNQDMTDPANWTEMQNYLDVEHFIDYVLLSWWIGGNDWPGNNWYVNGRNDTSPLGSTPMRFWAWDGEWSWDRTLGSNVGAQVPAAFHQDQTVASQPDIITKLWHALRANDQFMELFQERVTLHTDPGGALSTEAALTRFNELAAAVRTPVVAESARWGDALEPLGLPARTRDVDFDSEVDVLRGLIAANRDQFLEVLVAAGYYSYPSPQFCAGLPITVDIGAGELPTSGSDVIGGTEGPDTIVDVGGSDIICGFGGNDTIHAGGGNDIVYGGSGADTLYGDSGDDRLYGHADGDHLEGGPGFDQLYGHGGVDVMYGEAPGVATGDADYLWGGPGDDEFHGNGGDDWLEGSDDGAASNDLMIGGDGDDVLLGHGGNDTLEGNAGSDYLWGGPGIDSYSGGADRDYLDGGAEAETMIGGDGDDLVLGHGGNDTLEGNAGSDYLWGGPGIDSYSGGAGPDYLDGADDGENGAEVMHGDDGDDQLIAWGGDDTLNGGGDNDYLWGGPGADLLRGDGGTADACVDAQLGSFDPSCEFTAGS